MENCPKVVIYTDGSCSRDDGPGGWAAIIQQGKRVRELTGGETKTTSVRMELTAVVRALELLRKPSDVTLHTDCQFIVNTVTNGRLQRWQSNNWKRSDDNEVKNQDLWETLSHLITFHTVTFKWIKGHSGNPLNDRCDKLAKAQTKARADGRR